MSEVSTPLRLALPKGRIQEGVFKLLSEAGISVSADPRGYRPKVGLENTLCKILKPQSIVEMLHLGSRDVGFAGADWVAELEVNLVEVLDTGLDPVQLVAAAPVDLLDDRGQLPKRHLVVASEYERLARRWIQQRGLDAGFVRSYGATEVFPPEDADCIVDNTATGSTLVANRLQILDTLMHSSTRLYAHPEAMENRSRRERIEHLCLLLRSVLDARKRVMVEVNVTADKLEEVVRVLPSMREPTIARLHGEDGYAVKAAVPRSELVRVIPLIKARGGTDIVVTPITQIVS